MVFCKRREDLEPLAAQLLAAGFPAAALSAAQTQLERLDIINALRAFRLRVVVSIRATLQQIARQPSCSQI